jgi:membrane protein DedA with SNARE-associated domain
VSGTSLGLPALFSALLVIEAGVPLPVPGDVLMFLAGERASAHAIPIWIAIVSLELVTVVGTALLFFAVRGPGHRLMATAGPRVGLTVARLERAGRLLEGRGRAALAVGRATPGLRTITVVTAATSRVSARLALPLMILGGSIFIQVHFALGYALGPAAGAALARARTPTIIVMVALVAAGAVLWLIQRGRRGAQAWTEAACPACLTLGLLAEPSTEATAGQG